MGIDMLVAINYNLMIYPLSVCCPPFIVQGGAANQIYNTIYIILIESN